MTRAFIPLACFLFFIPAIIQADGLKVESSRPAPDLDALFSGGDGWIGGDGVYSVTLSRGEILWLFSDTWVGKIENGKRTNATLVNNTVGIQKKPDARIAFTIARNKDQKPAALIVPTDGRGWYWLQAGIAHQEKLHLFLNHVEKGSEKDVFGFRLTGMALATVANPEDPPRSWRITQTRLPNTIYSPVRTPAWGMATLPVEDTLYIYGIDEHRGKGAPDRKMTVARVPVAELADFSKWRYYQDGQWVEDYRQTGAQGKDLAWEYSVTPLGKEYLLVTTQMGLSPRIMGRVAPNPWGPWSEPVVLYECPEMARDKNLFTYAAKVQPCFSRDREIVVSYVVNSFDFWQVARDASLYWPRFVRVKLAPPVKQ